MVESFPVKTFVNHTNLAFLNFPYITTSLLLYFFTSLLLYFFAFF